MINEMFIVATRTKMRFPFRGMVSVEDLWGLNVENLDSVFKELNSQVKKANEESLLCTKSSEDEILDMQIEIVKYIVNIKLEEAEAKKQEKQKREESQKIMSILTTKENEELRNMSKEELKKN